MRGAEERQKSLIVLMNPEDRVPREHPLRRIKALVEPILRELSPVFEAMYSRVGRPSIPPEHLLKASLLMALYSVRSERLFCEQLEYNLLYRWFLELDMVSPAFDHSVFSVNRERLLQHDVAGEFFRRVVAAARGRRLMSDEHFTVDGTLIESWASLKSFRPKDEDAPRDDEDDPGNPSVDFHGEKRANDTHQSTTDPQARLARKGQGKEAKLSFSLHALMENRHGLLADLCVDAATGTAERENALRLLDENLPGSKRLTLGADRGYDTREFVQACRDRNVTPHLARNLNRRGGSTLDDRTIRHAGYHVSQQRRKRVEEIFGWLKTVGGLRRTRFLGVARTQLWAYLTGAAYNLLRMARLLPAPA